MEINKIYNMDNIDGMKQMIEEGIQVDSIVTDPPYNLSFMNKSWDSVGTPKEFQRWNERWAELAYQILKPGGYLVVFGGTRTYHRMVSGVEDAGFEICDTLEWIYGCLSEDTEILTLDGWKGINEISSDDKVFSYNYESQKNRKNRVGISNVNHVFKYDIEDEMVHLVNDNTDQLLTKNHKVLCKTKNREQIDGERTTYDSNVDYRYVDAGQIRKNSRVTLPLGTIYDGEKSIGGKLFSELVGLVLAEGWYQNKAVNISQSSVNADIVSRIRYILGKLNADYSEYKRDRTYKERNYIEHQFYITGDVANKIQSLIPNKKPTWDLLHISLSEKEHLYKGLMDGDGNWSHKTFYQNDNKFLEWFQILCHLMGKQARINKNKMCV
ncbi:MAG: DNA methyltransferase, partial [bacterium]